MVVYFTFGGLLFQINLEMISLYRAVTHVGVSMHEPRYSSFDKNRLFATNTFPFKVSFLKHHCLAKFSILLILSLKFSSVYLVI